MKKIHIPLFNDEYALNVYIGTKEELIKHGAKYLEIDEKEVKYKVNTTKGSAWNALVMDCNCNPLILINGELDWHYSLSTLAHEACHGADYIMDYIGMVDESGEFRAHTVGAVMRHFFKETRLKVVKSGKKR